MSRSRDHRYYEDSDDMVERIRRAREAFEKKTRAFQGPNWPYYEKRVIVGRKKKEDMEVAPIQTVSEAPGNAEVNPVPAETGLSVAAEPAQPDSRTASTAADNTAAWWAAQRAAQKSSAASQDNSKTTDESDTSDEGAAS